MAQTIARNIDADLIVYDCMDELQRRKEWLIRKQPEPWAAMVMSENRMRQRVCP